MKTVEEPWERRDQNGMNDPMVVRTDDLKQAIEMWAKGRNFADDVIEHFEQKMSIGEYLANESGVPKRRIWGILNNESKTTSFYMADKIIACIERPDLMPQVIPNPRWSQERWIAYMQSHGCY